MNAGHNPHARMRELDAQFEIDKSKITNIDFDGIDPKDAPDFVDAFIVSADYDGHNMSDEDIDELNEDSEFVHEKLTEHLY